jgi:hypothetical protein
MIVLQHNCNGTAVLTVAALEAAIERGAEVACLQEPYVGKKHTISRPGIVTAQLNRGVRIIQKSLTQRPRRHTDRATSPFGT